MPMSGSFTTSAAIIKVTPIAGARVCSGSFTPKFLGTRLQFQEPGEIDNQRELSHFRRLKTERAHAEPAMRLVRTVQEKHADQQHERDGRGR